MRKLVFLLTFALLVSAVSACGDSTETVADSTAEAVEILTSEAEKSGADIGDEDSSDDVATGSAAGSESTGDDSASESGSMSSSSGSKETSEAASQATETSAVTSAPETSPEATEPSRETETFGTEENGETPSMEVIVQTDPTTEAYVPQTTSGDERTIKSITVSLDTLALTATAAQSTYTIDVSEDAQMVWITVTFTADDEHVFSDDVSLLVNGKKIKTGFEISPDGKVVTFKIKDPNWSPIV